MSEPLAGLRIIELAAIGPAPFAGALLADLGADVIRRPHSGTGSGCRSAGPLRLLQPQQTLARARPEAVRRRGHGAAPARAADALTEGFRPGVADRLGLGPAVCLAADPRLVYGRMTRWGQDGPLAREAGHDIDCLALTGALHNIGIADLGGGAM